MDWLFNLILRVDAKFHFLWTRAMSLGYGLSVHSNQIIESLPESEISLLYGSEDNFLSR